MKIINIFGNKKEKKNVITKIVKKNNLEKVIDRVNEEKKFYANFNNLI